MKIKRIIPLFLLFTLVGCGRNSLPVKQTTGFIPTPYEDMMIPIESIDFTGDESNLTLNINEKHTYSYTYEPSNASVNSLVWKSQDPEIADVSITGEVTAKAKGTTTIEVSSKVETSWKVKYLKVEVYIPLVDFSLNATSLDLDFEQTYQIEPTFEPLDANNKELVFSSTNEAVATVTSGGLIRANKVAGTTTIGVGSKENMSLYKEINVTVSDKTVHVESVSLASPSNELEVGEQITLLAGVFPLDAKEYLNKGVTFITSTPDLVELDAKSGLVKAKATGKAKFVAMCEEIYSNEVEVNIFEVKATKINLINKDDPSKVVPETIELTNRTNLDKYHLGYTYETDHEDRDTPTFDEISYVSTDENVATVNKDGLITALGKGTTTIMVVNPYYPEVSTSVDVRVTIHANSVKLFSTSDVVYVGETLTISATISPTDISDPTCTFEVSNKEVVESFVDGNIITLKGKKVGETNVKVTCDGLTDTKVITVSDVFKEGQYIVGSADYSGPESKPCGEGGSWNAPAYARHMTHECPSTETNLKVQYKETITFHAGDEWKIRMKDSWSELSQYITDAPGCAISTGSGNDMTISGDNILVNNTGKYDIYYKIYNDDGVNIWVCRTPTFSIDKTSVTIALGETAQVKASNFEGSLLVASKDTSIATVSADKNGLATISPVAVGNTTIEFKDDNETLSCAVSVTKTQTKRTIYFNSNGIADKDDAEIFVHAWGAGEDKDEDVKLTLVNGQDIIYTASISNEQTNMVFVRQAKGSNKIDWDNYWNKTEDLTIDTSKNLWLMRGYDTKTDDHEKTYMRGGFDTFDSGVTYKVAHQIFNVVASVGWGNDPFTVGDAVCFAWVWGGSAGGGKWIKVTPDGSSKAHFECEIDITNFLLVRCPKGTIEPNWNQGGDNPGRIYNKTSNLDNDYTGRSITFNSWPDYNPSV